MPTTFLEDIGRVDNLNDPAPLLSSEPSILGVVISFMILATICATGRLWIRVMVTKTPGVDDLLLFLSTVFNVGGAIVLSFFGPRNGLGKHFILLGLAGMGNFLQLIYVVNGIYNVTTFLIKLALLFQYLRILEKGTILYRFTFVMAVVVSMWGLVFTFLAFVPCMPVSGFWSLDILNDTATRWGYGSHYTEIVARTFIGHSASNMFLDMVMFAIPIPFWLGKNVESKTRRALLGLFFLGAIVNICSIFRLINLVDNQAGTAPTFDPSWYGSAPVVLSCMEMNLSIICASLPVFWPIIKNTWNSRKIMITREFEITSEARISPSPQMTDEYDLNPLNIPPPLKPWECMGGPEGPLSKPYTTADQGIKLTPESCGSHTYYLGTGSAPGSPGIGSDDVEKGKP